MLKSIIAHYIQQQFFSTKGALTESTQIRRHKRQCMYVLHDVTLDGSARWRGKSDRGILGNFMQCTPKLLRATMAVFDGGCPLPGVWANQPFDIASAVFAYPDHIIETHRRDLCFEPAALIAENFTTVSAMMSEGEMKRWRFVCSPHHKNT